jgi:hypothetical protein
VEPLFQPVCGEIRDLINQQISQVKKKTGNLPKVRSRRMTCFMKLIEWRTAGNYTGRWPGSLRLSRLSTSERAPGRSWSREDRSTSGFGGPAVSDRRSSDTSHRSGSFRWTAVCRGATATGIVQSRMSRRSYGLCYTEKFDIRRHTQNEAVWDIRDGEKKADGQMYWVLRRVSNVISISQSGSGFDWFQREKISETRHQSV